MLIDTHAHLYWDSFKEDFDQVIKRAVDAGISAIINIGVDIEKSRMALDQVQNTNWPKGLSVYSSIGIHPHEASKPGDIEKLEEIYLSNSKKVVAVGECGLDFFFGNNPGFTSSSIPPEEIKVLQKKLFQTQITLAKKLNLPLIVHCRDDRSKNPQNSECWDEVLEMIGGQTAILHCYSGLTQTTEKAVKKSNVYIAFAANITYPKNEYLRQAAKIVPLNKILLETDSPFLAPQSKRGQRNEPSAVLEIARLIADLKEISLEEIATQTTQNAEKIFNIDPSTRFSRSG